MIKANELRIGNWVNHNAGQHVVVQNVQYYNSDLTKAEGINHQSNIHFSPIPITPEILEKCGFTTDDGMVEYGIGLPIGNGSDLFIEDEGHPSMSCGIKSDNNRYSYFRDVRYVHQLQNLYFALTGEELQIKL